MLLSTHRSKLLLIGSKVICHKAVLIEERSIHRSPSKESPIEVDVGLDCCLLPCKQNEDPHSFSGIYNPSCNLVDKAPLCTVKYMYEEKQ